jgi:general transcription factor 3C polypeptide 3 (transcription factor C subunit 4)
LELYDTALKFYTPLKAIKEENTTSLHMQIGKCFLGQNLAREAEASLMYAIRLDDSDTDARTLLARLYEERGDEELALEVISQILDLTLKPTTQRKRKPYRKRTARLPPSASTSTRERPTRMEGEIPSFETHYLALETELEGMRSGDVEATETWMAAAEEFTDAFRGVRKFYSWDKYLEFTGYSGEELKEAQTSLPTDLSVIADRLSKSKPISSNYTIFANFTGLHADLSDDMGSNALLDINDYRGIPFHIWLDIFMEYALCLAKNGQKEESYEIVQAAKDARPFYAFRDNRFLIHLCWCSKSLFLRSVFSL